MDFLLRQKELFNRNHLSEFSPVRSYDPNTKVFWCSGNDKTSYVAVSWLCNPSPGVSEDATRLLMSALSSDFPQRTMLTINLVSSTFVEPIIEYYRRSRTSTMANLADPVRAELVRGMVENRINLMKSGMHTPLDNDAKVLLKDKYMLVTIKCPVSADPEENAFKKMNTLAIAFEQSLQNLYFYPSRLDNKTWLMLMRGMLYPGVKPWSDMDEYKELSDQIFDNDTTLEVERDYVKLGDSYVRSMSVQQFPEETSLPIMTFLIGDPKGSQNQISCPFILTTHIYLPDVHSEKTSITKKARNIRIQNLGKFGRLVPKIGIKDENFTVLSQSLERGNRPVQVWTNLLVFGRTEEEMVKQSAQAKNFYEVYRYKLTNDTFLQGSCLQSQFPMSIVPEAVKYSKRFCTMTVEHAVHLVPIVADWKGNGTGANNIFYTRRGQVVIFDPFDTDTNMNTACFGESGAGKSVLTNDIAVGLYSRGGIVRIIDSGYSYKKTTSIVKGEFTEFNEGNNIIINPFTDIKNIMAELPALLVILEQMAAPKHGLTDYQMRALERITLEAWSKYENRLNITSLSEMIINEGNAKSDEEIRKLGEQFYPYTRHGTVGRFFDGDANFTMSGDWSVLELDDLQDQKELRTIVLLLMITKLNKQFYQGDRSVKKLLVIDEYWKFGLENDAGSKRVQDFLIGAFRLFRKYNASVMIATQAVTDLPDNSPMLQNAANVIIMKQKEESIEALRNQKVLALSDYTFDMLKTVRRQGSAYSDLFIYTGRGYGIARFKIDRFTQLMYTTDPQEVASINRLCEKGMTIPEAIKEQMRIEESNNQTASVA